MTSMRSAAISPMMQKLSAHIAAAATRPLPKEVVDRAKGELRILRKSDLDNGTIERIATHCRCELAKLLPIAMRAVNTMFPER